MANPAVTYEGRFDRIDRAGINPRPNRQIPVWLGGHSEPAYERGARLADGSSLRMARPQPRPGPVQHYLRALGKSDGSFGRELFAQFAENAQYAAEQLKRWRDLGGTHGSAPSTRKGLGRDINAHIDYLAEVRRLIDA